MWGMSWDNFVIAMAVIPGYEGDDSESGSGKEKIEVKDIWDVF